MKYDKTRFSELKIVIRRVSSAGVLTVSAEWELEEMQL
jgi:hypothetical protein